jgi:hypothetical protein
MTTSMMRRLAEGGDADAEHPEYKWIGLGIVVGSAVLSNLGVNVQKLSHVRVRRARFASHTVI